MNKKHVAAYAAVAAMFGIMGALVAINKKDPPPITTAIAPTGGKPHTAVENLFAQSLNDLQGHPQPLSKWRGKPLLVNFWATWCAPCVQEMPELSELAALDAGKTFNVIGIGIDSPSNIAEFVGKYKITYPIYVGGMSGTELSRQLGNQAGGLPFTVLIDESGKVRKSYLGRLKMDELRRDIASL